MTLILPSARLYSVLSDSAGKILLMMCGMLVEGTQTLHILTRSLLTVGNASNVDCNGVYGLSATLNPLDDWEALPTVVFARIAGGWSGQKR